MHILENKAAQILGIKRKRTYAANSRKKNIGQVKQIENGLFKYGKITCNFKIKTFMRR